MNKYRYRTLHFRTLLFTNKQGVALLLVISSIALLTWVLADFTFETSVNKIKTYNSIDKLVAKSNATAGLSFAISELRIYQEARNLIEKNESLKSIAKPGDIEKAVLQPFAFPIPIPKGANPIQRSAAEDFSKNTLLKGQLTVSITSIKGFLNPNNLRAPNKKPGEEENKETNSNGEAKKSPQQYIQEKLVQTIKDSIQQKSESDENFEKLYGNLEPELLVKELKYFVNNPDVLNDDTKSEVEQIYVDSGTTPKHAPLTSLDELYLLEGWPEDIIDLVKDRFTVHEVTVIAINDINKDQLKVIFPKLEPAQVEEFFKRRDGDPELKEEPRPFKSPEEFKSYLVGTLGVNQQTYDDRVKEFETAGLKFGIAGNLYKVISSGSFERAKYKITAFVALPIKPQPKKEVKKDENGDPIVNPDDKKTAPNDHNDETGEDGKKKKKKEPAIELMPPRIVEIITG